MPGAADLREVFADGRHSWSFEFFPPKTDEGEQQLWQAIRELERLIGKQTVDLEILRAARDEVKKRPRFYGVSKR